MGRMGPKHLQFQYGFYDNVYTNHQLLYEMGFISSKWGFPKMGVPPNHPF